MARIFFAATALAGLAGAEDLSAKKVHLMSYSPAGNWLFRGNMPELSKAFAYDELLSLFTNLTSGVPGVAPVNASNVHISIRSFDNILDSKDTQYEVDFAKAHPDLVDVTFWPLVGQLLPPSSFSSSEQKTLSAPDSLLWAVDQLPKRVPQLWAELNTTFPTPRAFYVHCEAGCDRTGEFSASWYMQYGYLGKPLTQQQAVALDTTDCGRLPYNVSVYAAQWYCVYLANYEGIDASPCY